VRLTPEEIRVLATSATGLNAYGVADTLGLSHSTVRPLIASAVMKLGARSKLEAVLVALRDGLIDLPSP
jgi:DNA-binding NarL/FixJ family response regulator